jgi:uncharacterized membrane protein
VTPRTFLIAGFLSLLPISELRGAIPFAITQGMSIPVAYMYCVALNALVGPLLYLFLFSVHKLLSLWGWYKRTFDRLIQRARDKIHAKVEKFGYWGVMLFVAVPLPITGAYTGTLGAWVLGLDAKRTFLAVLAGVIISGAVVTLISYLGIEAFSFFIKKAV